MAANAEHPAGSEQPGALARVRWRSARRQSMQLMGTVASIILVCLGLGVVATALQAGRDEARTVDAVLVLAPTAPTQALIAHSFELYRRGYGAQLLLAGAGAGQLRVALQERGLAEQALLQVIHDGDETTQLRAALAEARAAGAASVLIAGDGAAMARWLKVAGDSGLRAYGSPTPGEAPNLPGLVSASLSYWRYVLFPPSARILVPPSR